MTGYGHNAGVSLNVDALIDEMEKRGEVWADADAAAKALDDASKPVFAQCLLLSDGKTVGEREAQALSSSTYKRHLDALAGARRTANIARVKYDAHKVKIELLRTNASTQRAAMGMR